MKKNRLNILLGGFLAGAIPLATAGADYKPADVKPPAVSREFRGAWVATVANIDWPSKPGLPVSQQKAELTAIMERAVELNLNAIVLQVRPACDAIYPSKIEPWTYYVTGAMGKPPSPFYDPLAFAVAEAHRRGLELHAWFNPYRAGHPSNKSPIPPNHISKTHPELVRSYGKMLWLDPGERDVQDYSLKVVMDVVKRYDIDGVHFDDYFYPYKELDADKKPIDFPDDASWKKFGASGKLSRDDWRRQNVNTFIERLHNSIKAAKPWVKFGIAPFGIWQPGYPQQIKGFNAYNELYCDSKKWLVEGWVDYFAPQLYWAITPPEQSYPALLKWWHEQDIKHIPIWPGIDSGKVGGQPRPDEKPAKRWKPDEILNQIRITREQSVTPGNIHWSMKCLMEDRGGLATSLKQTVYAEPALAPAFPSLDGKAPAKPKLTIQKNGNLKWSAASGTEVWLWVLQTRTGGDWTTAIIPGDFHNHALKTEPDAICLTPVDRRGVLGAPVSLERSAASSK